MTALLEVENLTIAFSGAPGPTVDGVSFTVQRGETLAVVGESGSGKTLSCKATLRILPRSAQITAGEIRLHSRGETLDLVRLDEKRLRRIRGDRVTMIFQEPMSSFSPLHTIGSQVLESLTLHRDIGKREARRKCLDMFERVGFPDPERAWRAYPFELSGGLRQRAMIAMAQVVGPDLLIADEPTTALDVTTQAQVLGLINDMKAESGMGVILVTHDLGVVANMADSVVVMRKGRVMESGSAEAVIAAPAHAYTRKLVEAAPLIPEDVEPVEAGPVGDPILVARNVVKTYTRPAKMWKPARVIQALKGVDLTVPRGDCVAVVGESGCGKSTFARIALGADTPDPGGEVRFFPEGGPALDLHNLKPEGRKAFQRRAQLVFQDPYAALSPRLQILDILAEPLRIHRIDDRKVARQRAAAMMERVGLDPAGVRRYPHAFSGGQRQRISIARALMLEPSLLVLDEPTSALDVSVQAQTLDLLEELKAEMGLSYLFISHDLAVVARMADSVAVMRDGRVVEQAPADTLFADPAHPYTRALIAASPEPDMDRRIDLAEVARGAGSPQSWPERFRFHGETAPTLIETAPGHFLRAHA